MKKVLVLVLVGVIAMAHGAPDYSNVRKSGIVYRLDDMGEMAVRLGSIISYDRRGDVFWYDGFDEGLNAFTTLALGNGASVDLSTEYFFHPPYSVKLTSGDASGNMTSMYRRFPVPYDNVMGFAFGVQPSVFTDKTQIRIIHYDGENRYRSILEIDYNDQQITITTEETPTYVIDDDIGFLSDGYFFSHIKLVVDLSDHSLIRLGLNNNVYDLTGYTMVEEASAITEHIYLLIGNLNTENKSSDMYVDNVVITVNED